MMSRHSSDTPREFTTFCHISEFGEAGYEWLRPMAAASSRLVLWAPSTVLLSDRHSSVSPREFVSLVESNHIQVIAREQWLTDERRGDRIAWPGAAWVPAVDGRLKEFLEEDERKDPAAQRVRIAPPAEGKQWAEAEIERNPRVVKEFSRVFSASRTAVRRLAPPGVVEAAARAGSDRQAIARAVLTDVANHAEAFRFSAARTPYFLDGASSRFLRFVVKQIEDSDDGAHLTGARRSVRTVENAADIRQQLAWQLVDFLKQLDISFGSPNLKDFLGGEGHRELVDWYLVLCDDLTRVDARELDGEIMAKLRADLEQNELPPFLRDLLKDKLAVTLGGIGLATAVASCFCGPEWLDWAGFGTGTISVGRSGLQRLHWISDDHRGPQWPYLYAFNGRANRKRWLRVTSLLSRYQ